jgi:hypothetical protein
MSDKTSLSRLGVISVCAFSFFAPAQLRAQPNTTHVCTFVDDQPTHEAYNPATVFRVDRSAAPTLADPAEMHVRLNTNFGTRVAVQYSTVATIAVDVQPLLNRAIALWNRRLLSNGMRADRFFIFSSDIRRPNEVGVIVNPRSTSGHGATATPLGHAEPFESGSFPGIPHALIRLHGTLDFTDRWAQLRENFDPGVTNRDVATAVVYLVLVHELGHILGLAHPGVELFGPDVPSTSTGLTRLIDVPVASDGRPAIMTSNSLSYFSDLRRYRGRPITIEDIDITQAELSAMLDIIRGHCVSAEKEKRVRTAPQKGALPLPKSCGSPQDVNRLTFITMLPSLFGVFQPLP